MRRTDTGYVVDECGLLLAEAPTRFLVVARAALKLQGVRQ